MKIGQIIAQLQSVLPNLTDLFSEQVVVNSITSVGTLATATTATAHGLTTLDEVNIPVGFVPNPITSLTRVGDVATAITANDHDITVGFTKTVNISGALELQYNGEKTLLSSDNRRTFTFTVTGTPTTPATGTIFLNENLGKAYTGLFPVTVISPTVFTYVMQSSPPLAASGTLIARKNIRISGVLTAERAKASYTAQKTQELWAFVIPAVSFLSKSRRTTNDSVIENFIADSFRHTLINDFSVLVFIRLDPALSISGRIEYDLMNDVMSLLIKSLFGVVFDTTLSEQSRVITSFVEHGMLDFEGPFYVHEFKFQAQEFLTNADLVDPGFTVAFRDYAFNIQNAFNVNTSENLIDLDKVDLP